MGGVPLDGEDRDAFLGIPVLERIVVTGDRDPDGMSLLEDRRDGKQGD